MEFAMDHLSELRGIIGPPSGPGVSAAGWRRVEHDLGVSLPEEFKVLADWYSPIRIGRSILLANPETGVFNFGAHVRQTLDAYRACDFSRENFPDFPDVIGFGGPDGLIPLSGTAHGEEIFLYRDPVVGRWQIVVFVGDDLEFHRYDMGFAEWLHRYLTGEDMAGPNSARAMPNPLPLMDLLVPEGTAPVERFGPLRPS
ncbi:SMI1/KNR4 family protein [Kitasatospora sp. NPDC056327]|uniref:SMI1/KNR4 family protein n=1 Tax=Kitasatospora sp. NPDC056327 TaxID=3345785 RepID=UPI0035E009E1